MTRSLINLGDLSRPATTLIEKISDAIGWYFEPKQLIRIARAKAEAEEIKELARINLDNKIAERALNRFISEEVKKQMNMESIILKSLEIVSECSKPENIDEDWLLNFFDKCKTIGNEGMQSIWARILAGEANSPGKFSKRTLNTLTTIDQKDAEKFQNFCSFVVSINGKLFPLIFDYDHPIF
jgi:endonuclease III-like uncharacterized protein